MSRIMAQSLSFPEAVMPDCIISIYLILLSLPAACKKPYRLVLCTATFLLSYSNPYSFGQNASRNETVSKSITIDFLLFLHKNKK